MLINKLLNKFDDVKVNRQSDNLANFNLIFEIESLPNSSIFYEIEELLKEYPKRDSVEICFKASQDDFFSILKKDNDLDYTGPDHIVKEQTINNIIDNFNSLRIIEDKITVKIKINKNYDDGLVSVYSLDKFITWILEKDLYEMMIFFSNLYKYKDGIIFISYDKEIDIATETFKITDKKEVIKKCSVDRKNILDSRLEITNVQNVELNLIPEDFNIIKYEYAGKELEYRFNSIRDILSVAYISDISLIDKNFSEFRINGYKSSDFKIHYEEIQVRKKNDFLYKAYRWIYNEGNLIDKSKIARNIVSLHCRYQKILDLDVESLKSIETNYAYYLKSNTDDFLEEKKNLRLSMIEEGKLLSEALNGLISSMGKNLLAYFTFLATLIVSTTLANEKFKNIFTYEISQIVAVIIFGSFVFLIYSFIETGFKKDRTKHYVDDLIIGYGLVLGKENSKEIINQVKSYKNIEETFDKKKRLISGIWIAFNLIILLVLDWLSGDMKLLGILNLLK